METLRIFTFTDYKRYLLARIENFPKAGRGQLQKLAAFLSVHPTLVSQVLRGDKNFTSEQTCLVSQFFGLSETESDYLLALVEHDRAGNPALKKYWTRKLNDMKTESQTLKSRLSPSHALTDQQRIEFYSSWEYIGVRLATSIEELSTTEAIADRLGILPARITEIVAFLVEAGLCIEEKGRVRMGPLSTFISRESPHLARHHLNWRMKALQAHQHFRDHELSLSLQVTISKKDRVKIRELLLEAIEKINALVGASGSEELCCLNVDWFDVRKAQAD